MTSTSPGRPPQGKKLSICCDQTAAKVGPHRDERTPLFECEFEDLRHKPGAFEQDDFRAWWKCVYCGFVNPHPRDDVVVPSHCWCWFDTPIQQELGIVDAPEAEYANTRCHPHGTIEPLSAEYELRSVNWIYSPFNYRRFHDLGKDVNSPILQLYRRSLDPEIAGTQQVDSAAAGLDLQAVSYSRDKLSGRVDNYLERFPPLFSIDRSAAAALRRLCWGIQRLYIWVDAVCIIHDLEERAHQVSMMHIWPGEVNFNARLFVGGGILMETSSQRICCIAPGHQQTVCLVQSTTA